MSCGACSLCCKVLQVPDIQKPARMLCWWTTIHGGCQRHNDKLTDPNLLACAQFKCLWLESQDQEVEGLRMSRSMRPDQCHVMFGPQDREDETLIYVHVDPDFPDAWVDLGVLNYLRGIINRGGRVELFVGEERFMFTEVMT